MLPAYSSQSSMHFVHFFCANVRTYYLSVLGRELLDAGGVAAFGYGW